MFDEARRRGVLDWADRQNDPKAAVREFVDERIFTTHARDYMVGAGRRFAKTVATEPATMHTVVALGGVTNDKTGMVASVVSVVTMPGEPPRYFYRPPVPHVYQHDSWESYGGTPRAMKTLDEALAVWVDDMLALLDEPTFMSKKYLFKVIATKRIDTELFQTPLLAGEYDHLASLLDE